MGISRRLPLVALGIVLASHGVVARAASAPQPQFEAACAAEIERDLAAFNNGVPDAYMRNYRLQYWRGQFPRWEVDDVKSLQYRAKQRVTETGDAVEACGARFVLGIGAAPAAAPAPAPAPAPEPVVEAPEVEQAPRQHHPENEASECLVPLAEKGILYGGFYNKCPHAVNFYFCNVDSTPGSSSAMFDCAQKKGGVDSVDTKSNVTVHNKDATRIHWAACKLPDLPLDVEYTRGQGLDFRCR